MERTIRQVQLPLPRQPRLLNVAAYARVSSGKDAMQHSLSEQVSFYNDMIQNHEGWRFCGVFADEDYTGTRDDRPEFQNLMAECRAGNIDLIITKSITRLARNTVLLLQTVRELKSMGINIYFEKEETFTLSADGELLLTILASYAQEESRSASENQKWRVRTAFENGELVNLRYLFGYHITKHGVEVDPETAPVVREIFERVIANERFGSISRDLNQRGIVRRFGGTWNARRIHDVVANEKYTGNALLQKKYRNNHIEKKEIPNNGELPQYYAEETHPAIIDMATFEAAQLILKKVASTHKEMSRPQRSEFTGKIRCPYCGKSYKRNTSNGSVGWNCSTYLAAGKEACHGKKIPDSTLKAVCAEVLGLIEYDAIVFMEQIDRIEVPQDNHLRFIFKEGRITDRTWKDRSRRDSWTEEMKEAASKRTKRQRRRTPCQE